MSTFEFVLLLLLFRFVCFGCWLVLLDCCERVECLRRFASTKEKQRNSRIAIRGSPCCVVDLSRASVFLDAAALNCLCCALTVADRQTTSLASCSHIIFERDCRRCRERMHGSPPHQARFVVVVIAAVSIALLMFLSSRMRARVWLLSNECAVDLLRVFLVFV